MTARPEPNHFVMLNFFQHLARIFSAFYPATFSEISDILIDKDEFV
jgi:hypothetical protein